MGTPPPGAAFIEDLDAVVEDAPTWRRRWLLPFAGAVVLAAVLAVLFVKIPTIRPAVLGGPPPSITAYRPLAVPPGTGTFISRVPFSGVAGLGAASESEGSRSNYRLPDGRLLALLAYPARGDAERLDQVTSSLGSVLQPTTARGVPAVFALGTASPGGLTASHLIWIADGTNYQLTTSATDLEELQRFAAELR